MKLTRITSFLTPKTLLTFNPQLPVFTRQFISIAALLILSSQSAVAQRTAAITMSRSTKYQYIDGFGGTGMNGQWADVYTQQKVNLLWGQGDGQVGLNIMRVRINPNENNWGEYGNPIRWARRANPSVQVFATPWTPPKMYKTSRSDKYQNEFGTWVWPLYDHPWGGQGSNGGTINDQYIGEYADFLERYRSTMEAKGCPIDIISIQNECDYTPTATDNGVEHASYESCIFSPKQMAAMVKAARTAVDPKCLIMGPETFGWGQANYNNTLAAMKDAVDNIDIWGNHLYGSNDLSFINSVTKKTGKHMWMTEFLIDYPKDGSYTGQFSAEYEMIKSLENAMQNGYNGYVYYNMLDDFFACNHGGSETTLWKRAYIFSHYAKYATGKIRIKSVIAGTAASGLTGGSAYVSEGGDTISLFVLNSSASEYNLTINTPINPTRITAIVTGESVNAKKIDLTDQYVDGTKKLKTTLQPGTFYTFVFEKAAVKEDQPAELATSPKLPTYSNPICPYNFFADPTSVEYDGRLYVYGTNDQQEFDLSDGLAANSYGKINQFVCMSTADMVNWTNHGTIDVKAAAPWISASWAPSIVSRVEDDGLTHFYMYFTNSAAGIGVLTATSPLGPWTDPLGHALIDRNTPRLGNIGNIIDPGAAIKPDGSEAYLTFGGGDITGTALQPGNARIVKLGSDMISLDGDIHTISAPCHFEANELNYIGSRWVYSYCTRWTIASNWSTYSTATAPTPCSIVYMTATNPLTDKWSYKGELIPNPGRIGYPSGNNHSHLQKFGSTYYIFYHTQWLESQLGYSGGYRNVQMNRITVAEASAKIAPLNANTGSLTGVAQLTAARVNPYLEHPATMSAGAAGIKVVNGEASGQAIVSNISSGDWTLVRGVQFSNADYAEGANSLIACVEGKGTLEVRLGDLNAEPVATIDFNSEQPVTVQTNLSQPLSTLQTTVYFVFSKAQNARFYHWQFSSETTPVESLEGDIDGDGSITVADITLLINMYLGTTDKTYDLDGDGSLTVSDITQLITLYLK